MKKHSLYLREDQIAFLKSLPNASSFVRESLDQFVAKSDRTEAEKTIVVFNGIRELETKIANQALVIDGAKKETEKIEEKIEKGQLFLKTAQKVAKGEFQVQQHKGKFRVLIEKEEGKYILVTDGHDTEEEARKEGIRKGKIGMENMKKELKELEQKKQRHNAYLKAQKSKLKTMEDNLQKLYASMK